MSLFEFSDTPNKSTLDALFLERLDAFMDRSLAELKAFSQRENMSFNQAHLYVSEWHSKYIFQSQLSNHSAPIGRGTVTPAQRTAYIHSTLCDASRILESLSSLSGVHAFVLAVDPLDSSMSGFLGGSLLGREFWRTLRGGGDSGAKAFKVHCLKHIPTTSLGSGAPLSEGSSSGSGQTPAQVLKAELYDKVRTALRTTSGIRTAEMKWTSPDRLSESYGVSLVGWPPSIPYQNPSALKNHQRKELLQLLDSGAMKFVRTDFATPSDQAGDGTDVDGQSGMDDESDLSWALTFDDASGSSLLQPRPSNTQMLRRSRTPEEDTEGSLQEEEGGPRKRPKP